MLLEGNIDRTLENFSFQPTIYKTKLVRVVIDTNSVGKNFYFPKDEEIDNSIIKAIKIQ